MSSTPRDRLRSFTKAWSAERGANKLFEAAATDAKKGIYNTRQHVRGGGLKGGRLNVGPKLTAFEGAKLNTLQIMGAQELPHRERARFLPLGRAGVQPGALPSFGGLSRNVAAKVAYAKGAQPTFFKVISGAAGKARVGALFEYLGTREDPNRPGERQNIEIVTSDGRVADTKQGRDELVAEWEDLFRAGQPARDVYRVAIGINSASPLTATAARELIQEAVGDRRFVFAVRDHGDGDYTLHVAVATEAREKRGKHAKDVMRELHDAFDDAAAARSSTITFSSRDASGHAFAGIKHQLDRFKAGDFGLAFDDAGIALDATDTRTLARSWTSAIGRGRANDVIHTVFSARAGTDRAAFQRAVLATMDEKFGEYRFAVAVHDDKQHVHVHAVIQTHNRAGERLVLYKADLESVRETLAEHARANGIEMVHLRRDDLASARSFSKEDAAAVRTGRAGPSAQARYEAKTRDAPAPPTSAAQEARRAQSRREWRDAESYLAQQTPVDRQAMARIKQVMQRHGEAGYKSTRNRKLTTLERAERIFTSAQEAMMEAKTETALFKQTATARDRIEQLAAMAKPADAAKLREQTHELSKMAAAQAELMRAKAAEQAAMDAARATSAASTAGTKDADKELSRQAEALRRAAVAADRAASAQDPLAGAASADPTDRAIHKVSEQERTLARQALEKAERDGAAAKELERLRKAYHATLEPKGEKGRDKDNGPEL